MNADHRPFPTPTLESTLDAEPLDQFLRIEDAARILSVSKSWLYQHRDKLPFVVRLPDGPLRVSVSKLRGWMEKSEPGFASVSEEGP